MTIRPALVRGRRRPGSEVATIETIPEVRRYIAAAQRMGLSLRVSLKAYRKEGGRIRTEDFSTLWRDEKRKAERAS